MNANAKDRQIVPREDAPIDDDRRWQAVCHRASSAEAPFVYAVRTTGIYCRPDCTARRPLRKNVEFYASPAQARAAGYRPCLRCHPDAADPLAHVTEAIAHACRLIREADTPPDLAELSQAARMSPSHFHRMFKSTVGITPKAYASSVRAERSRRMLRTATTVTAALHDAGYGSHSSFYGDRAKSLGMSPTRHRSGGTGETIRYGISECWLGLVLAAATSQGVCAILLGDDREALSAEVAKLYPSARLLEADTDLARLLARVVELVQVPARSVELPLDIRGTAFQRRVWDALLAVPPGSTVTYAELARRIGAPRAVRAVGNACAANPLAVAVPCHRALRSDGTITGYRWGPARKRSLLAAERDAGRDEKNAGGNRVD